MYTGTAALAHPPGAENEFGGKEMKKMYQIPALQVILLKKADVIVTSDGEIGDWDTDSIGDFAVKG